MSTSKKEVAGLLKSIKEKKAEIYVRLESIEWKKTLDFDEFSLPLSRVTSFINKADKNFKKNDFEQAVLNIKLANFNFNKADKYLRQRGKKRINKHGL